MLTSSAFYNNIILEMVNRFVRIIDFEGILHKFNIEIGNEKFKNI
tara:strand:- start:12129 stop:12263 length:135 start_codon:yes stop_codon:yes gene_type:complete